MKTYSASELKEMVARGESKTDFARLRATTDTDLEREIAADSDWDGVDEDWFERARAVLPRGKRLVSLRFDKDVIEWFRASGPGYQTRINHVLRTFMERSMKTKD
jgi:uncharacterized protein (DUF4415 family)